MPHRIHGLDGAPSAPGTLRRLMRPFAQVSGASAILAMLACGGGGGSSTATQQGGVTPPPPPSGAPKVFYADTLTAPVAGGESGQGGYLSIFGKNFGLASGLGTVTKVLIGGHEVANYRYLGFAKVGAKLGLQQITVQVGAVGAVGTALPVQVVVNGTAADSPTTFTPTAGHVLFVALNGNDAQAIADDITHPWRHLQHDLSTTGATSTGAYYACGAGDQIVLRGGHWTDADGHDGTWMRASNDPRNGTAKAWIHITAYPGPINGNAPEDVHYTTPAGQSGGIAGPWSAITGISGNYFCVSNLRMDVDAAAAADAAPINLQYTTGPWRVVNNELGPWPVAGVPYARAAGISGEGYGVEVLGNHIHDIAGTSALENHGIYVDTAACNWEIAYNWIHDITGGSLLQFYDSEGGAGVQKLPDGSTWPGFTGMRVHHNWLENAAKYGLTIADGGDNNGKVELRAWNNVIIGTQLPPVRTSASPNTFDVTIAYNTIYAAMTAPSGTGAGYFRNEYKGSGAIRIYDNLLVQTAATTSGTQWFYDYSGTSSGWTFRDNLYWGATALGSDSSAVSGDPVFTNAATGDFSLGASSAAIGKATQALPFTVNDDFTGMVARPASAADLGAFEHTP